MSISIPSSSSSLGETHPMPLEKVVELVCSHAELQSEHQRLKKKIKLLNQEIEEMASKKLRETTVRFEALQISTERHINALSLNCDETMRRKFREVDEIVAQMRRDMFDRISSAIASTPPPAVKRLRNVASQVTAASAYKQDQLRGAPMQNSSSVNSTNNSNANVSAAHISTLSSAPTSAAVAAAGGGGDSNNNQNSQLGTTPIARRVHALSELVAMSTESSLSNINNTSSNSNINAQNDSNFQQQQGGGAIVMPTQSSSTVLYQTPRLYQPVSNTNPGAAASAAANNYNNNQSSGGGMQNTNTVFNQPQTNQQPSVRFDMTPGMNASMQQQNISSIAQGATPYEGEMHTFLW